MQPHVISHTANRIHKVALLLLVLLLVPVAVQAQRYSTSDKKAITLLEKGQKAITEGRLPAAAKQFKAALEQDPRFIEAHLLLAECLLDQQEFDAACESYYNALTLDPEFFIPAWLLVGNVEMHLEHYDKAIEDFQAFIQHDNATGKRFKNKQWEAKVGIASAKFRPEALKNPVPFDPENLGKNVNSPYDEYLPALTVDGSTLIFTRRGPRTQKTNPGMDREEDFYTSTLVNGAWSAAKAMPSPPNTGGNEGAQCISQDGKIMFFTACDRPEGEGSCDIYMAVQRGGKWAKPRNIGGPVNTGAWESQPSFSIDGKTLYFASSRPGGYGGIDIWSTTYAHGKWSTPENLGPTINTPGDEASPFIHYDDHTLYFASDGHAGMGGKDLYCSRRGADGKWQKPQNLGYPINTEEDESSLIVAPDGRTAYYASSRDGSLDIYSFELPEAVQATRVTYQKGVVFDKNTLVKLGGSIEIIDIASGNVVANTSSDKVNGEFTVSLPTGAEYALHVTSKGYLFYSANFNLEDNTTEVPPTLQVPLSPIEVGESITLRNIFFETAKYDLLESSLVELGTLIELLKNNPALKVELAGHTDNVGAADMNQRLSENRAKAVYDHLVAHGIDPSRLTYKGYGATQPIADNSTEEGRQQNRRTVFTITGIMEK